MVVEGLNLKLLVLRIIAGPARDQVVARDAFVTRPRLVLPPSENIALEGHRVPLPRRPIDPEPASEAMPIVMGGAAAGELERILALPAAVDAIRNAGACLSGEAQSHNPLVRARPRAEVSALRRGGIAGDDVDHAVDGVRPPEGRTGPADDLDPLDVIAQQVRHVPVYAGEERGVDGPPVDQHEQLVRVALREWKAVQAARGHDPSRRTRLVHLQVWGQTQDFRDRDRTGSYDLVMIDDV